jgi:hypothetical protein
MLAMASRHPRRRQIQTLGELVAAHGSGGFTLWAYNRAVDGARARTIANSYSSAAYDAGPMPLVIGQLPDGSAYLLDGQHRLAAGKLLGPRAALVEIEVVYEPCADDADLRRVFRLINSGTPVPAAYYDDSMAEFIGRAYTLMKDRWRLAHAVSDKPKRPNFSEASVRLCLDNPTCRDAVGRGLLTPGILIQELERVSLEVDLAYRRSPELAADRYGTKGFPTLYPVAVRKGFCAGLILAWGLRIADDLLQRVGPPI